MVFGIILGTGCGGGIVVDGKIWNGRNSLAGEWGHNRLPDADPAAGEWPGPKCYCGHSGCIETFVSGTGLERDFLALGGNKLSAKDITKLALEKHPLALTALARLEHRLAKALANVINLLDPDVIVVGGGLSNYQGLYHNVPKLWAPYIFGDAARTQLKKAQYGDSSGVRGAAWLWPTPASSAP
jgi:predicted NBD/HSP70 family sugar kinase